MERPRALLSTIAPYSHEQLEEALKVLRKERRKITKQEASPKYLERYLRYDLRCRPPQDGPTTWVDDDGSGDFDPAEERRRERHRQAAKRKAEVDSPGAEDSPRKKAKMESDPRISEPIDTQSTCMSEATGSSLAIVHKVETEKLPSSSVAMVDHDNVPSHSPSDISAESSRTPELDSCNGSSVESEEGARSLSIPTPEDPSSHGCQPCWDSVCSLIDAPNLYPCQRCLENNSPRELIIPPKRKRSCESCNTLDLVCSYLDSDEHSIPCRQCRDTSRQCIAEPALQKGKSRAVQHGGDHLDASTVGDLSNQNATRNDDYDTLFGLPSISPGDEMSNQHTFSWDDIPFNQPLEPVLPATGQNDPGMNVSQPVPSSNLPAYLSWLDPDYIETSPQDILQEVLAMQPPQPSTSSTAIVSELSQTSSTNNNPLSSKVTTEKANYSDVIPNITGIKRKKHRSRKAFHKKIRTSFAHPIDFTYTPTIDCHRSKPCHFCHDFTYGLLGLGEVEVEVIDHRNGNGYTEVEGGHVSRGVEPTRMCKACGVTRVRIGNCEGHVMRRLEGWDETTFNTDMAFETLLPIAELGHCVQMNAWCSICTSPAFHTCTTVNKEDWDDDDFRSILGIPLPNRDNTLGCGLLLCTKCNTLLNGKCNGDLTKTIEEVKSRGAGDLRADAEFLIPDNELYATYQRKFLI
ncbi:hypothetical protein AJ80_05808 [Polytolypa hystricis UAMH7299]|uniref:Zn(2)-C6 fungal-type domain-containing protein n=1 Tax=Polytolypa hystricis (strain UAMH7299) TaxID=1447883 RepID=A0A2B7XSL3_POLH7|nr:hypothetical protein AJ80_05808 [Polytolypa hystricis UAMH7299]